MVVVTQPLTSALREQLAQELLKISQPVGELQRPLEVTILLKDEIQSGNYPLSYEMQFGEWLREELKEGGTLSSQKDPDISILLRKARFHHAVLFGPALDQWAPEISDQELWQAMSDTYPEIVAHWDEDADERNQILALCRIYFSLVMKDIASKTMQHDGLSLSFLLSRNSYCSGLYRNIEGNRQAKLARGTLCFAAYC